MNAIRAKMIELLIEKANSNPEYYLGSDSAYLDEKHLGCLFTDSLVDYMLDRLQRDYDAIEQILQGVRAFKKATGE